MRNIRLQSKDKARTLSCIYIEVLAYPMTKQLTSPRYTSDSIGKRCNLVILKVPVSYIEIRIRVVYVIKQTQKALGFCVSMCYFIFSKIRKCL